MPLDRMPKVGERVIYTYTGVRASDARPLPGSAFYCEGTVTAVVGGSVQIQWDNGGKQDTWAERLDWAPPGQAKAERPVDYSTVREGDVLEAIADKKTDVASWKKGDRFTVRKCDQKFVYFENVCGGYFYCRFKWPDAAPASNPEETWVVGKQYRRKLGSCFPSRSGFEEGKIYIYTGPSPHASDGMFSDLNGNQITSSGAYKYFEPVADKQKQKPQWVVGNWYRRTTRDWEALTGLVYKVGEIYQLVWVSEDGLHGRFKDADGKPMYQEVGSLADLTCFEPADPPDGLKIVHVEEEITPPPCAQEQNGDGNPALAAALTQWQFGQSNAAVHFFLTGQKLIEHKPFEEEEED